MRLCGPEQVPALLWAPLSRLSKELGWELPRALPAPTEDKCISLRWSEKLCPGQYRCLNLITFISKCSHHKCSSSHAGLLAVLQTHFSKLCSYHSLPRNLFPQKSAWSGEWQGRGGAGRGRRGNFQRLFSQLPCYQSGLRWPYDLKSAPCFLLAPLPSCIFIHILLPTPTLFCLSPLSHPVLLVLVCQEQSLCLQCLQECLAHSNYLIFVKWIIGCWDNISLLDMILQKRLK